MAEAWTQWGRFPGSRLERRRMARVASDKQTLFDKWWPFSLCGSQTLRWRTRWGLRSPQCHWRRRHCCFLCPPLRWSWGGPLLGWWRSWQWRRQTQVRPPWRMADRTLRYCRERIQGRDLQFGNIYINTHKKQQEAPGQLCLPWSK